MTRDGRNNRRNHDWIRAKLTTGFTVFTERNTEGVIFHSPFSFYVPGPENKNEKNALKFAKNKKKSYVCCRKDFFVMAVEYPECL